MLYIGTVWKHPVKRCELWEASHQRNCVVVIGIKPPQNSVELEIEEQRLVEPELQLQPSELMISLESRSFDQVMRATYVNSQYIPHASTTPKLKSL